MTPREGAPIPAEDRDLTGQRLGGYTLLERIGRGGMGNVYRARQESLDKIVALKVLPPGLAENRKYIQRFIREARAAGRLSHPNIVQGFDVGEMNGRYFFAMEYVDGETLLQRLNTRGPLKEAEALAIARQVTDALAHASAHGIVHRDIKPDNILVGSDGAAKVADLGLAKVERPEGSTTESGPGQQSTKEVALGTPAYISPEQARGSRGVDVRSDLYSLGMSLYHLTTGRLPFPADSRTEMLALHLTAAMPDARAISPRLTPAFSALLRKLGEKDPDERPQTPEELLEALEAVRDGQPLPWDTAEGQARRARLVARRRRQRAVSQGGIALAVVTGVGLVAVAFWPGGGAPSDDRTARGGRRPPRKAVTAEATPEPGEATVVPEAAPPPPEDRTGYAAAERFAAEHPEDPAGALERFKTLAAGGPPGVARDAAARAKAIEKDLAGKHKAARAAFGDEVRRAIEGERFADAAARLAGADRALAASDPAAMAGLATLLADRARDAFDRIRVDVDKAQMSADYARARALLAPVMTWGVAEVSTAARPLLEAIENMARDWEKLRREGDELTAVRRAAADAAADLAARRPERALERLAAAGGGLESGAARGALSAEQADAEAVRALLAAVLGVGDKVAGRPFALGKIAGTIRRVERDTLVLKLKAGEVKKRVAELDTDEYLALAGFVAEVVPDVRAGVVVLAAVTGRPDRAKAALAIGGLAPEVVARLEARLERAGRAVREGEAARRLDAAESAVRGGDPDGAETTLATLERDFGDTEVIQASGPRLRDLRNAIARARESGDAPAEPGGHPDRAPGLLGFYYQRSNFADGSLKGVRVDPAPEFSWSGEPYPGVRGDSFAVRWVGYLDVPDEGEVSFRVKCRGGVRLLVGKHVVCDALEAPEDAERQGRARLAAGEVPFVLEYRAKPAGSKGGSAEAPARIQIWWTCPGAAEAPLAPGALAHSKKAAAQHGVTSR